MSLEGTAAPLRNGNRVRTSAVVLLSAAVLAGAGFTYVRSHGAAGTAPAAPESKKPAAAAPKAPEVEVESLSRGAFEQPIRVTGSLKSDEVVAVSTKATGLIREVRVKEGDRVTRGELLVRIDDDELRAQRDRAQAAVQAAEAKLTQSRTAQRYKNIGADTDLRRAQETVEASRSRLKQMQEQAKISDTEAETRVASAKSVAQSARERLKALQEGSRKQEKAAADLAVARAQANVNKLKSNWERRRQLLLEGAIAEEAADNARRDYEVALAELNSARQQRDLTFEGPRSEDIRQAEEAVRQADAAVQDAEANRAKRRISSEDVTSAETAVRQAEAGVEAAKANLGQKSFNADEVRNAAAALAQARADVRYYNELISQTRVFSPVNGVVSERKAHAGESVSMQKSDLVTIVSGDTLFFEATAPEAATPYLRAGLPADVTLDALPGVRLRGTVRDVIPVTESTSRSVRLRISVPKPAGASAVVGGFARAVVHGQAQRSALSVPREALLTDEGETAVYLLEGGHARKKPVQIGNVTGPRMEILSGLRPGDRVIVTNLQKLSDGMTVVAREGSR